MEHDFRLILVPDGTEFGQSDQNLDPEQALVFYADEGRADLDQIAREQIYLSLPLKPICAPDCAGLCATCGGNRNRIQCGCRSTEVDPRLAPLLELKKRLGGGQ